MINEKKGLNEACKEASMPHFNAVSKYAKKNAEFRKELEQTYKQLPYSVQANAGRLPEKQFLEDLLSLKRAGITVADMTRLLGVSRNMITIRLKAASTNKALNDV
jgi:Fic family protein